MKYSLLILALIVVVAGCNHDTSGPSRTWTNDSPGVSNIVPTIDNIWPNEDETAWSFDYNWDEDFYWSMVTYPDSNDVPPLPDWDEISDLLEMPLLGDSVISAVATYRMAFNGLRTAGGGVTAQNLEETIDILPSGAAPTVVKVSAEYEFLRRLRIARPDLAVKFSNAAQLEEPEQRISARDPLLIHGGVWEKTSRRIGTYGDVDRLLAWKFLTDELRPGSEFSHQLVPDLADDVYLHCRIERRLTVETAEGEVAKAIECLYLVDFGVSRTFSPSGNPEEYARPIIYGSVIYAPTVGPVYSHERPLADTTDLIGISDLELILEEFDKP
jgi:hypothetical protein